MLRLFRHSALLITGISFSCFLMWKLAKTQQIENEQQNGWAGIIEKHQRLDSLVSPKLVLAGGSNIMFGLDSQVLQDSLQLPVVNLGLGGALGLSFFLNEAKQSIRKGDFVLISVEYFLDKGDYEAQLFTASLFPPALQYIDYQSFIDSLTVNWNYRLGRIRNLILLPSVPPKSNSIADTNSVYFRKAFNSLGDIISHLNNPTPAQLDDRTIMNKTDYSEGIKKLNDFANFARRKGVRVFFSYPSYCESEYKKNSLALQALDKQMRQQLAIEFLETPEQQVYPDSLFFDTVYHLNNNGRTLRTQKVIKLLRKQIIY